MNLIKEIKKFVCSVIYHTPKKRLNLDEREVINRNGLIHFCEKQNIEEIIRRGVVGNIKKAMNKNEIGFTWYYIHDEQQFDKQLEIIHNKGKRSRYDAYIIVKGLSDEQMEKLRIRREVDNAVIYPGTLKTKQIEGYCIK